jgi:hypothetical protein
MLAGDSGLRRNDGKDVILNLFQDLKTPAFNLPVVL